MSEGIAPHLRVPRDQREAGIDHLDWERTKPLRPLYLDVLGAIGLALFLASAYFLAWVMG